MKTIEVGDVIAGKYTVTGILGRGGMGVVVSAHHAKLGDMALKFLRPDRPLTASALARFEAEAKAAFHIKSDHAVKVVDVDDFEGAPFIVMELLQGEELTALIRTHARLGVAESVDLLLQACEAVHEAHLLSIVHRDLKPANLFVSTTADGLPRVKVLDFGVSKSNFVEGIDVTSSTAVVGTPLYMSPEQLRGAKGLDARTDVWALGVILYEMLTGHRPFAGDNFADICASIVQGHYEPLSSERDDVPPALEQVIADTLVERDKRIPSVELFASRLAAFGTDRARQSAELIQRLSLRPPPPVTRAVAVEGLPQGTGAMTGPQGKLSVSAVSRHEPESAALGAASLARPSKLWTGLAGLAAIAVVGGLLAARHDPEPSPRPTAPVKSGEPALAACVHGATPECEAACRDHQAGACNALATALVKGFGAPKDTARAAPLYEAECDAGNGAACSGLGALYAQGDGVPKDFTKALSLYTKACDAKYARGCLNLGSMHFAGDGVQKDEALGVRLFMQACNGGEPRGCFYVSIAYTDGKGVPKDAARSRELAKRACDAGLGAGCVRVAAAKLTGEGAPKDVAGGLAELDALCTKGEPAGCDKLANVYDKGQGTDVPADPLRSREYAKKACDLGSQTSCAVLAMLTTKDTSDSVAGRVSAMFQARCDQGDMATCARFGQALVAGDGVAVDRERGRALLKKACAGGVAQACKGMEAGAGR